LVIEQLPGTLAQGTCELHAALVLAQVPIDEQSEEARHSTDASFAHVPMISGQVPGFALHTAFGGLLQVPVVRHTKSAAAWVAPLQTMPFFGPENLQVPGVVGHWAADPHAAPPEAQVPPVTVGQVAALVHAFAVHDPTTPPQAASFAHTVVPSVQVF
jgi:hypothetical protein